MQVNQAKRDYKTRVEQLLKGNDSREAWRGIKTMVGLNSQQTNSAQTAEFANGLNCFFAGYETDRPSQFEPKGDWREGGAPIRVTSEEVRRTLSQINTRKSIGPDGMDGNTLQKCCEQLSPVFTRLFQASLDSQIIPRLWKMCKTIPLPKKTNPSELNDFRPVALTPVVMKCFE